MDPAYSNLNCTYISRHLGITVFVDVNASTELLRVVFNGAGAAVVPRDGQVVDAAILMACSALLFSP